MQDNRYAVIMAGGKGERFWPLSTSKRPKQVLSLVGGRPMLAQAVDRLKGFIPPERVIVITNASLVDVSREAVPELPSENIIGEPFGRDTAAACALGAAIVRARCKTGSFCILTADHVIKDVEIFQQTLDEELFDKLINNEIQFKGSYMLQQVLIDLFAENFHEIIYDVRFQKDNLSAMSEGKKAFVDHVADLIFDKLFFF